MWFTDWQFDQPIFCERLFYGVNIDASGNLSGHAWSTNVGWINFKPTNGGVTVNQTTGQFDGYAWSENVGWIHFHNANPAYTVQYIPTTTGTSNVTSSTSSLPDQTTTGTSNGTSSTPPLPDYLDTPRRGVIPERASRVRPTHHF